MAWRFKTHSVGTRPEYKLEGTPLMVNGVVYATAPMTYMARGKQSFTLPAEAR